MILGFTWLHEHNPEIDWAKGEVKMNQCWHCSTCMEEARDERRAKVRERATICACHAGHLPFLDINLLDPPPLAFPHREALYEDVWGMGCEPQSEDGREGEFASTPDTESPDEAIEVGDRIYATTL